MRSLSKLSVIAAIASALGMGGSPTPRSVVKYKKKSDQGHKLITAKKNGLKEFNYGENSLFELNQKNADRKARLAGWI